MKGKEIVKIVYIHRLCKDSMSMLAVKTRYTRFCLPVRLTVSYLKVVNIATALGNS